MKVARKWIFGAAAAGALALASAPWSLSGIAVRSEMARQIREATGLIAEAEGRAVLALLPRPRVKIENVIIRDRDGNLRIEAGQLRGELRVLPKIGRAHV